MNRVVVSIAPPQRYVNRMPSSCGNVAAKLAASRSNVAGRRSWLGCDAVAGVVDGVVAAPQDPVVGGQPEVVELVAGVRHAVPVAPPDRRALLGVERLGHQDVVVDRHEQRRQAPEPHAVRGGRDDDLVRLDRPAVGERTMTPPARAAGRSTRLCSNTRTPRSLGRGRQAPAQLGRVDHHALVAAGRRSRPARAGRGSRLRRRHGPGSGSSAAPRALLGLVPQLVHLVGLGRTSRVPVSSSSQSMPSSRTNAISPREVAPALGLEPVDLLGEVEQPVRQAVGQPRLAEAAVAAARAPADALGLEDDDAEPGVRVEQPDRRPQAGEPAADDGDIRPGGRPRAGGRAGPASPSSTSSCRLREVRRRSAIGRHGIDTISRITTRSAPRACAIRTANGVRGTIFVLTPRRTVWHDPHQSLHSPQRVLGKRRAPCGAPSVASSPAARAERPPGSTPEEP